MMRRVMIEILKLIATVGAVGTMLCLLWLGAGTLFFDDPTITYSEFLLHVGKYFAISILLLIISVWSIKKHFN
ncbi:hypothetical protein BC351_36635 [Paenibacillus ferrarius]|uniref:Uncharacterized protein n=1 Tax=Paenibacillus ferrarius TaxID=1469647 RepID=A0A1V4HBR5_9BACL|nr:hypothetical protein [Paenibacillus ferrarius]OPH50024.1 hypothetical protein BC351_36635 [Paenibacillus ferrarius]